MSPVLVVGVAPSASAGGREAFVGSRSGEALERMLGLQPGQLRTVVDTVNLADEWPGPGPDGHGDALPPNRSLRAAAEGLDLSRHRGLVLCGRAVFQAFGFPVSTEYLTVAEVGVGDGTSTIPALLLPHPSLVSRWWNSLDNREATMDALLSFVRRFTDHKGGGLVTW